MARHVDEHEVTREYLKATYHFGEQMRARSITDEEISLIKAMLDRDIKNKDIQFFFNRPDRPVNTGRITGIANGTYSNSSDIDRANEGDLDSFLAEYQETDLAVTLSVPSSEPLPKKERQDTSNLQSMFKKEKSGIWRFILTESDQHECKEEFWFRHSDKWLRAIAALANNRGGYILFGVRDKNIRAGEISNDSYQVTGLKNGEFVNADPADFTKKIKAMFDPTPRVEFKLIEFDGLKVGAMKVDQHTSRPVIATKNEGNIKEGDIFFRYPGQSSRIKYSDLRSILDNRDVVAREQILPMVEKILSLGPEHAMIADLSTGVLSNEKHSIVIDEDLLDQINFTREGEFKEEEGAPTLRLIGDVRSVNSNRGPVKKSYASPADLIQDFLDLKVPYDPKEYIRCAIEGGNGAWLPMHYYARKANMDSKSLVSFIKEVKAPEKRREVYIDRASGKKTAFRKPGGQAAEILEEILNGTIRKIEDPKMASNFGSAIAGLDAPQEVVELKELLNTMKRCEVIARENGKASYQSVIRRGIARIDELFFMPPPVCE